MSESENDRKESGGNNMDMKRIRKIVGAENLLSGFLPVKSFSFSRADAAYIFFCIFKSLRETFRISMDWKNPPFF